MVSPAVQSTVQSVAGGRPEAIARVRLYEGEGGCWNYTSLEGFAAVVDNGGVPVIKIIDTDTRSSEFEQEIYEGMTYNSSSSHFHFFESDEVVIGLSFGSTSEAPQFASAVNRMIPSSRGAASPPSHPPAHSPPAHSPPSHSVAPPTQSSSSSNLTASNPNPPPTSSGSASNLSRGGSQVNMTGAGGKKKKGFFSKFGRNKQPDDFVLSGPTGFRHESHIGWDPENGFDVKNIPPEWRKLFQAAGVKKSELEDANTAKFIMQTVTEAMAAEDGAPPPPPGGGAPPPPPPPGPPPPGGPPPAANRAGGGGAGQGGDLMAQIQQGKELKKAEEPDLNALDEGKQLGLADTLANAMAARRGGVSGVDEDDADEWDDDEWDD